MALFYKNQEVGVLFGSKTALNVRTAVTLEAAYVDSPATKIIPTGGFSQIVVDIDYTMGAGETSNSIEVKVEVSSDGTNFYRILNESISAGTSTVTVREFTYVGVSAAVPVVSSPISLPLDVMYKYMKFSVKETGVATTFGTCFAEYTLSGA